MSSSGELGIRQIRSFGDSPFGRGQGHKRPQEVSLPLKICLRNTVHYNGLKSIVIAEKWSRLACPPGPLDYVAWLRRLSCG